MMHSINGVLIRTPSIVSVYYFDNGWGAIVLCQNNDENCVMRIPRNTCGDVMQRCEWIAAKTDEIKRHAVPTSTEFVALGLVSGDDIVRELARIAALPPIDDAAKAARVADDLLSKLRKR